MIEMFREKIQTILDKDGMTVAKLAVKIGLPYTTLYNFAHNHSSGNGKTLKKISAYFEVK